MGHASVGARCVALVGPYLSGKTTLFESLLAAAGVAGRRGAAGAMSTEPVFASASFLGEPWTLIDCPGSIEFTQQTQNVLMAADIAVVVADPSPDKVLTLAPILKFLDDEAIPHLLFINRMDQAAHRVRDILAGLQALSAKPLVLRQVPIRSGDRVEGYVDLASERAYRYRPGQPSDLVALPESVLEREREARAGLLESLADHDDALLEKILEDIAPSAEEVYRQIARDVAEDLIVPVLLGAAAQDHGVRRLWKALRHDTPSVAQTAAHRGIPAEGEALLQVVKTQHAGHTGKLSIARIWRGSIKDGAVLGSHRVSGIHQLGGSPPVKLAEAHAGDVVALGRLDAVAAGDVLTPSGTAEALPFPAVLEPVFGLAIGADNRNEEVKLSGALQKLIEEDPSLSVEHNADTGETVLWGQGEIQLQAAIDRLARQHNVKVTARRPEVAFKESIRRGIAQHARHKRQTGGHGQFADIRIEIEPLPRGGGFSFGDRIVGGSVPKQYIPAVGEGVRDFLTRGPLGYPVVDVAVTLVDGAFHSVDSSDMAFKTAARMAMAEGMAKCTPFLLEPIFRVEIAVPSEHTSKVQRLVTGRRGQLLGFDARAGWAGWDVVEALMPQAELHDLIVEIRSATQGVGSFQRRFDHLAEARGRVSGRAEAIAS
jgi:elongation factor G